MLGTGARLGDHCGAAHPYHALAATSFSATMLRELRSYAVRHTSEEDTLVFRRMQVRGWAFLEDDESE